MAFPLNVGQIADALSFPAPFVCHAENVARYWPLLEACLDSLGLATDRVKIAALGTIRAECPRFVPMTELGGGRYFTQMYENRAALGNFVPGDGARFCGRGFIQITGRRNYEHYGKAIGVDLLSRPEEALEPQAAAEIFAAYFYEHHDLEAANRGDWRLVRRTVNGGFNGLDVFLEAVGRLQLALDGLQTPAQAAGASA